MSVATKPQIAVIIPLYQHSVLVAEAVTCALNQQTEIPYKIILVNDGCKFAESDRVCRDFALAYPQQVYYLYRPNGGLSAARNTGVEFALNTWDSIAAIYFLDADNRISPHTLERSYQTLVDDDSVGWVYPSIDMFGQNEGNDFDYRGAYSINRHFRFNVCEAGSMIRRAVFAAGCRYDESMRLGFEDWEFWWQAIAAGYRGKHLPESGFQYRKRFESMLSNSERDSQGITAYMRRKHRGLLSPRNIVGWEQQEAPRYGIFVSDTREIRLTSDPAMTQRKLEMEEFQADYHRGRLMPTRYHRPFFLVFAHSSVLEILEEESLIHNVFWHLEKAQEEANFACLTLAANSQDRAIVMKTRDRLSNFILGEQDFLLMTTVRVMDECILDEEEVWIHSLITPNPLPHLSQLKLQLPIENLAEKVIADATYNLLATFKALRRYLPKIESQPWDWHQNYLPPRSTMFEDARIALNCRPVYPKLSSSTKQVGFILSILEFGGVEKVALNLARVLQESGWEVHLFVFGERMQQLPPWARVFSTVNFYQPTMNPWQGERYFGTKNDLWSIPEEQINAQGLLGWLDVAINFHNPTVNKIMARLKRSGVVTVMSLHVHDLSPRNRPAGHGYLTLGYEHAYDLIIPCSHQMADWCRAMGIPEGKIIVVPNATGYPLTEAEITAIVDRKQQRRKQQPATLRVLFLGRFDRQKGLDRLVEIVERSRQMSLPLEWKLVGNSIVGDGNYETYLATLTDLIHPPALTIDEINSLYEWADILLLPSYWEGLPLTIWEAMRLGVVVISSDVGGITEAVRHLEVGLTVPNVNNKQFVGYTLDWLQFLIEDRAKLNQIAIAATAQGSQLTWKKASSQFIKQLHLMLRDRYC